MAELEAITDIHSSQERPAVEQRQFGRRFMLVEGKLCQLGKDAGKMDFAIPEDDQISRFQATVLWDGERLTVRQRGISPPDFPRPPVNPILTYSADKKDLVETSECTLVAGESFWIGQTKFTLCADNGAEIESPVDATYAPRKEERTRSQLEKIPFTNPSAALKAMEQLPSYIKAVGSEQALFRQMLRVLGDSLPRADAVGIVRIPPGGSANDRRVALVESIVRDPSAMGPTGFVPSRKLSHLAILERRRSCLHLWSSDPRHAMSAGADANTEATLAALFNQNQTPWAICTPFQDGSKHAIYVSGRVTAEWSKLDKTAQDRVVSDLVEYQKITELISGLIETTLRTYRLARQNSVIRQAWHRELWPYMDDPTRLEAILQPQEKEVSILFCDLRNYSLFASENEGDLAAAWRNIAAALETMSSTITDLGGVVGGFRGDAVLGFWGWPDARERQIEKAARAAIRIREKLGGWLQGKQCGLGLTHGRALAGRLGAHDLAVVDLYGPVVNLSFRLEALTKAYGVGIIISQEVADRLSAADPEGRDAQTRKLGLVRVKGFTRAIPICELYSPHSATAQAMQWLDWNEAVEHFTSGRWSEAYERFSTLFPDDPAAQCIMRTIERGNKNAPANWDGSFIPIAPEES